MNAGIIIPPHSVNVSLNEVAEFNCTALHASTFFWLANNQTILNSNGIEISPVILVGAESEGIRMSILRVAVSSIDNATNITCSAVTLSPFTKNESDPALLLVQGIIMHACML